MQKITGAGLFLLISLVLVCACGHGEKETTTAEDYGAVAAYKTFTYRAEGVSQILQLRWQSDTVVAFVLEHRQGRCNYTLSGRAVNQYFSGNTETDTDAVTGEDYEVDIFLYNPDDCRMAIRVAQDTTKVQLQLTTCEAAPDCALQSVGMLKRAP